MQNMKIKKKLEKFLSISEKYHNLAHVIISATILCSFILIISTLRNDWKMYEINY